MQRLAAGLWTDRAVMASVRRAAEIYAARRAALADLAGVPCRPSGINVWVPVPDEDAAVRALLADGWAIAVGTPYRLSGGPAARSTTAALDVSQALRVVAALNAATAPPRRTRAA